MSLYEFVHWYDIFKNKPKTKTTKIYQIINNKYYIKQRQCKYLINHYKYDVNVQIENYFFSLLLMFKPWRMLEDLKNGSDTYTESFYYFNIKFNILI